MKRLLLATAAVALLAPGAGATTGSCLELADAAGDAYFVGGTPAAAPDGLDVLSVQAEATTSAVTVVFSLAGAPEPVPGGNYEYELDFENGTHLYALNADIPFGDIAYPGNTTYSLNYATRVVDPDTGTEISSWEIVAVSGSFDLAAKTVTVTAPASAFGSIASGQEWTVTGATSNHGAMSFSAITTDSVAGPHTLVAGSGCA